ncbi:MAG: hypothetical protein R3D68_02705 [Hyphomicrobiaceae bacterium]
MRRLLVMLWALAGLALALPRDATAEAAAPPASIDDTARILAGLSVPANSPLHALMNDPGWKQHAQFFDKEWAALEKRQLSKVRTFSESYLKTPQKTLFYFFSGPDILYGQAFFPKAKTYVLAGLEPVGLIPDLAKIRKGRMGPALAPLKTSLRHLMGFSYFITLDMGKHLAQGPLPGVMPILYVFLSRAGNTVKDAAYVNLDADGKVTTSGDAPKDYKNRPRALKITFVGPDKEERTLYYFSTDLANSGVAKSGFLKFCQTLAPGDAFVKSASYLMHNSVFSTVREFVLANSRTILQDDTGVPLSFFKKDEWTLQPYGVYTAPIPVFKHNYQTKMKELFAKGKPPKFDFSLGYRWRPGQSNLVQATRK